MKTKQTSKRTFSILLNSLIRSSRLSSSSSIGSFLVSFGSDTFTVKCSLSTSGILFINWLASVFDTLSVRLRFELYWEPVAQLLFSESWLKELSKLDMFDFRLLGCSLVDVSLGDRLEYFRRRLLRFNSVWTCCIEVDGSAWHDWLFGLRSELFVARSVRLSVDLTSLFLKIK